MLNITVIQPPYYFDTCPDQKIADFLISEARLAQDEGIIVLPEYSNAGGLSDKESEILATSRAKMMLDECSEIARSKSAYVAVNVLETRGAELFNSTYLFDKSGKVAFVYDKVHLPPSEIDLGVTPGSGSCVCEVDGICFAFMTCYDVYFNEQIEYIASKKPDIILIPGYQRNERTDIIMAQAKLTAFRCNSFVARASYSMNSTEHGGCSMIASPDGEILKNLGAAVGSASACANVKDKYLRTAGFGGKVVRNDDFINDGLRPDIFK